MRVTGTPEEKVVCTGVSIEPQGLYRNPGANDFRVY